MEYVLIAFWSFVLGFVLFFFIKDVWRSYFSKDEINIETTEAANTEYINHINDSALERVLRRCKEFPSKKVYPPTDSDDFDKARREWEGNGDSYPPYPLSPLEPDERSLTALPADVYQIMDFVQGKLEIASFTCDKNEIQFWLPFFNKEYWLDEVKYKEGINHLINKLIDENQQYKRLLYGPKIRGFES